MCVCLHVRVRVCLADPSWLNRMPQQGASTYTMGVLSVHRTNKVRVRGKQPAAGRLMTSPVVCLNASSVTLAAHFTSSVTGHCGCQRKRKEPNLELPPSDRSRLLSTTLGYGESQPATNTTAQTTGPCAAHDRHRTLDSAYWLAQNIFLSEPSVHGTQTRRNP